MKMNFLMIIIQFNQTWITLKSINKKLKKLKNKIKLFILTRDMKLNSIIISKQLKNCVNDYNNQNNTIE